jgi:ribosomal protein S18 acetylase RimI-like enzyme
VILVRLRSKPPLASHLALRGCGYRGVGEHIPELALAVHPHARGQRVGEALLLHLLEQARSWYDGVVLSVRAENPAVRLYQRLGFAIIDTTTNRVGGQSWVMLKQHHVGEEDANADARSSPGSTP